MKKILASAALLSVLAAPAAFALQPTAVPDTGKLTKSPAGSTVQIRANDQFGTEYNNYYVVQQDGTLKLVDQVRQSDD
ncbi:hypothetical protein [Martelella endophytica]|uniref:Uncharacterized protein n=1 Tax=Martelella endophytica TaxID=1486262 RepID=A0A0D5LMF2_MAREN|nr:hypothetical protein [Martelella endophytica]AJY45364.1 hypothetical protein TM49_06100 [Martelella endophytica]